MDTQQQQAAKRNRLPTLAEVLRRHTRPPVDLYCYYLFLQSSGQEDTLDFWLDVQQHENLCRAYFRDVRKSGRGVGDDWPRYADYARKRGSVYSNVTGIRRGSPEEPPPVPTGQASGRRTPSGASMRTASRQGSVDPFQGGGGEASRRTPSPRPSETGGNLYPLSPTLQKLYPSDQEPDTPRAKRGRSSIGLKRASTPAQPYIPRDSAITRTDLIASAERIFSRYLMPSAEHAIYLPPSLQVNEFPLSSSVLPAVTHPDYDREADAQARVPDMFHVQKEYVYREMEQDSFPRFLRAKAFGNLTKTGARVRLVGGLLALWAAFATAFAFIFLDSRPRLKRLWSILPFSIGVLLCLSHTYDLDPLLVLVGLSETTPFRHIRIKEPYVKKLLVGRAVWVLLLTAIITAILVVIFYFVPGHRL